MTCMFHIYQAFDKILVLVGDGQVKSLLQFFFISIVFMYFVSSGGFMHLRAKAEPQP